MGKKMTVDCFKLRDPMLKCPNVSLLANGLARVYLSGDSGREIFDFNDVMMRGENFLTDSFEIEPFIGGSFEGAVIEIEPINVNEGFHCSLIKNRGHRSAPAPWVETTGGI